MGNANCCKRGEPFIPGEVLDRVIAEKSEDEELRKTSSKKTKGEK